MEKKIRNYFVLMALLLTTITVWGQTTIINPTTAGAFEGASFTADGWSVVNAATNRWQMSTSATAGFTGLQCAYISNSATSPFAHTYTMSSGQVSSLYRDVTVPAGETQIQLSFKWICAGEGTAFDRMRIWLVPTSNTPTTTQYATSGAAPTGVIQVGATNYNVQNTWTSANVTIPAAYAGTTFRLVFQWRNDGSGGTNPPIAIDDVSLTSSCTGATTAAATAITSTSATLNATTFAGATGYNFRYRVVGSPTWTLASGNPYASTSAPITGLSANTSYEFQVAATGAVCNVWSSSATFYTGYCVPSPTSGSYWLTNVVTTGGVTNISNSTSTGGYNNYTAISCSNYIGGPSTSIALTTNTSTHYYYCWIDWNNDFDFLDANETIFATTGFTSGYTGSITIPAGTANGNYRMRVANSWSGTSTSCTGSGNGEYEDYTFSVVSPPSCTAPTGLTASSITTTSATVSWTAPTSGTPTGYNWKVVAAGAGSGGTAVASGTTTAPTVSASATGLTANTSYDLWVQTDCGASGTSTWAGPTNFYTGYCVSTASGTSYYISNFATSGGQTNIANNSAGISASGYGNFTAQSASNYVGGTATSYTATWNTSGGVGFGLWIDWNNDLDFLDVNEAVYVTSAYNFSTSYTGSISIPAGTANGNYRMRIRIDYNSSAPSACGAITDGETEDYTFTVVAAPTCYTPATTTSSNNLTSFTVNWTAPTLGTTPASYEIYYATSATPAPTSGTTPTVSGITGLTHTESGLTTGNTYYVWIRSNCGGGDVSGWSAYSPFILDYCVPTYTTGKTSGDLISNIQIIDQTTSAVLLSNNTGTSATNPAYTNFSSTVSAPNLQAGSSYNVSVTVGTWGGQHLKVWIDYNDNGVFESTEVIGTAAIAFGQGNVGPFPASTFSISLACNPPLGLHRMRVRDVWSTTSGFQSTIDPCASYGYGETEDYMVNVTTADPCPKPKNLSSTSIAATSATLNWAQGCAETEWDVYLSTSNSAPTASSTPTYAGLTTLTTNATSLTPVTTYYFWVRSVCATGSLYSDWSGPNSFTTLYNCGTTTLGTASGGLTSATIAWTAGTPTPSDYQIEYGVSPYTFTGTPTVASTGNVNSYLLTGLATETSYEYKVRSVCGADFGPWTSMGTIKTGYCVPTYTNGKTDGDLISNVSITGTTLSNNSGTAQTNPSYTFFGAPTYTASNYTANLVAGTNYTVNVTVGSYGSQNMAAWIDLNQNGVFEASEKIGHTGTGTAAIAANGSASFVIAIPCNPTPGTYRLRLRDVYSTAGSTIDPCANYGYGETEDYNVTILPPPPCPAIHNLAYSGLTSSSANLSWTLGCAETAWDIHVSTSATPPTGTPQVVGHTTASYSASGLSGSTTYYAHVRANCGGSNGVSTWTTISFTTPMVNDLICGALPVVSSGQTALNTYSFMAGMSCNNQSANNSTATADAVTASCGSSGGKSVWYTFTTPSCVVGTTVPFQIELSTDNTGTNFDTKLALFTSSNNTCSGTFTQVICDDDGGGSSTICGGSGLGSTSTILQSTLLPNKQYWVLVDGYGGATGDFTLSGRVLTAPHTVATINNNTGLSITSPNVGATAYTYYAQKVGTTGYTVGTQTGTVGNFTLPQGYSYRTQVMYRCGASSDQTQYYRTEPQITALTSTCPKVTDLTCTYNGDSSYTLTWTAPAGTLYTNNGALSGYIIYYQAIGSSGYSYGSNPQPVCSGGTCSLVVHNLSGGGYNFWLKTRCSATVQNQSNVTTCSNSIARLSAGNNFDKYTFKNPKTGYEFIDVSMYDDYADFGLEIPMYGDYEVYVNNHNEIAYKRSEIETTDKEQVAFDFIIAPNPSQTSTNLYFNNWIEQGGYVVVDMMGRTLQIGDINKSDRVNIDASNLPSGVYMIVVSTSGMKTSKQFVVTK